MICFICGVCQITETRSNFTSAPPSEGCSSPLEWNPNNMLFNNNTGPEQTSNLTTQVDDILSNIIDEGLDDLNITEMALEDGKSRPETAAARHLKTGAANKGKLFTII